MYTQRSRDTAHAIILGPNEQTVIVLDPEQPDPKWKFPGGKIEEREDSSEAASRELKEETGLIVPSQSLVYLDNVANVKKMTTAFFYLGETADFSRLKEKGDDGELIQILPLAQIFLIDFLPKHWDLLISYYTKNTNKEFNHALALA